MFTPNFEEGYALFKEKRYAEALSHFRLTKTTKGRYNHLAYLGYCHQHGLGVPQDLYTARLWYKMAMEYGGDIVVGSWIEMEYTKLKDMDLTPKDLSYVEFEDYVCGRIVIKIDKKYSLGYHFKDDRIEYVNDDCSGYRWYKEKPYDDIVGFIYAKHTEREKKRKGSDLKYHKMEGDVIPSILDETLRRDYNHFHLRLERGVGNKYTYRKLGDCYTVIVPKNAKFEHLVTREAIIRHGMKMMVMAAEEYLPKKLAEWSAKTGLQYKTCKISRSHTRYGCYRPSDQSIELSCHLLKYDDKFIDMVIVHELCHSLYLNHYNEFYYAVLKYGGEDLYDLDIKEVTPHVPYDI